MAPVHTKIRDHPENFKSEKFTHTHPHRMVISKSLLLSFTGRIKVKQSLHKPEGSRRFRLPDFKTIGT